MRRREQAMSSSPASRKPRKRYLKVSKRRTRKDWAYFIKELLIEHYPLAEKVVLVMDNLNTHSPASLYEVFPPAEAKRLSDKLEIHYTRHPCQLVEYRRD